MMKVFKRILGDIPEAKVSVYCLPPTVMEVENPKTDERLGIFAEDSVFSVAEFTYDGLDVPLQSFRTWTEALRYVSDRLNVKIPFRYYSPKFRVKILRDLECE